MNRSIALKFFAVLVLLALGFVLLNVSMAWSHVQRHANEQMRGRAEVLQMVERTLDQTLKNNLLRGSTPATDAIAREFSDKLEKSTCVNSSVTVVKFQVSPRELANITGGQSHAAIKALFESDSPSSPSACWWQGDLVIEGQRCMALVLPCAVLPDSRSPRVDVLAISYQSLHHRFKRELTNRAMTGMFGFAVLLALVCVAFHRIVSRRLGAIADHFTALAAHPDDPNQEPLAVDTHDEIGRIASSFNVLNQILRNSRDRLDELVQRRTEALAQEIDERRRAEDGLKRLAIAVEQAAEMIMIIDVDGMIQYVNPAFEHLTGYSLKELAGRPPSVLRPPNADAAFFRNIWDTVRGGKIWSGRMVKMCKDGKQYEQDTTMSPVRDAEGNINGFVALGRDVSAEVALEQQLRQSQKMEAVGRLAGGVAHDFNNLLTVINGYSDLLAKKLGREHPLAKDVGEIKRAGERASSLTRQLLAFSRRQVLQPKLLDLNILIADMENMLRRLIGEDIELIVSTDAAAGKILADPGQIEQVILNLVVNARDAMPKGGKIVLSTTNIEVESRPYVSLSISDTGHGMSEETMAHIFEPFFTTKDMGKGTGLGLSTVYGIVKQSGGEVRVSSHVDRGATFQILLPRLLSARGRDSGEIVASEPPGGRETILLVEDDELVRNLTETLLRKAGYTVLTAADGLAGLETYRQNRDQIDMVMTDLVMPRLGGRGLIERLSLESGPVRVLYMSGYSDDDVIRRGGLGADCQFIGKPFAAGEMLEKVREALDMEKPESILSKIETNPDH